MKPNEHGYLKCALCGCSRPSHLLVPMMMTDAEGVRMATNDWKCSEAEVCARLRGGAR